jgi:hypothetical protein
VPENATLVSPKSTKFEISVFSVIFRLIFARHSLGILRIVFLCLEECIDILSPHFISLYHTADFM